MDKEKIGQFANQVYRDMAGTMTIGMAYLGLKSGLFRAMAEAGEVTASELSVNTGLHARYVEEWLKGMTAAGWLDYDPDQERFSLPPEHAFLVASEGTDHFMGGLFLAGPSLMSQAPKVANAFREGGGVGFDEFDADWIEALDLMNGGPYERRLGSYWLSQLPDVVDRLNSGGRALDIGCGVGRASFALAHSFPKATIVGVDPDGDSIAQARKTLEQDQADQVRFIQGTVEDLPDDSAFDFAMLFDCLHDLTLPAETVAQIRSKLTADGVLLVMEPKAADHLEDNVNPLGATYYGFSLFHCMTQSLAQGGPGLGTCLGPARTMALLKEGGFSSVEQLPINSQTNLFYAARG